jgi:hypothetical protein
MTLSGAFEMTAREPRVRYQLFLPLPLARRLDELAAKPGTSKSAILADAVQAWLHRRGTSELEDRFGHRLDRMTTAIGRIERDGHVLLESLALFVRYELAIHPPLADGDAAGQAMGRERFEAFVGQVGRQLAAGRRTLGRNGEGDR